MFTALFSLLTSGAGGGIVGGVLALFRTAGERKERLESKKIDLERDAMEYANIRATQSHEKDMLTAGAEIALKQAETEGEIAADITNSTSKGKAVVSEFKDLNTSGWVDNTRALIRPVLSIFFTVFFTIIFLWSFNQYRDQLTAIDGKEILMGLFLTLEFAVTSILSFYFVSRRNAKTYQ